MTEYETEKYKMKMKLNLADTIQAIIDSIETDEMMSYVNVNKLLKILIDKTNESIADK